MISALVSRKQPWGTGGFSASPALMKAQRDELTIHSHFPHPATSDGLRLRVRLRRAWGPPTQTPLPRDRSNYKPQRLKLRSVFTGSESPHQTSPWFPFFWGGDYCYPKACSSQLFPPPWDYGSELITLKEFNNPVPTPVSMIAREMSAHHVCKSSLKE